MRLNVRTSLAVLALVSSLSVGPVAFAQNGPVADICANDIQKFCANKGHGHRQTRSCLEAHRKKLSPECRHALDTTGGGWRYH